MFFRNLFLVCLLLFHVGVSAQVTSYSQLPANLRAGLVAFYPFNNDFQDISGNGYNGTTSGGSVPFIADRFGNSSSAIQLGGGYITTSTSVFNYQYNQAFSVSLWFTKESSSDGGRLLSTECPEGNFRIAAYGGNGSIAVQYGSYIVDTIDLNQWVHLVYTYDNRTEKVYINGQLVYADIETVTGSQNFCAPFTIGAKASSAFDRWIGKADDIAVYNRAISSSEVNQLFHISATGLIQPDRVFNLESVALKPNGFPYVWNSISIVSPGRYRYNTISSTGQDSICFLDVNMLPEISYSAPTAMQINTPITPLIPTQSGSIVKGVYGRVTTYAGSGNQGSANDNANFSEFNFPTDVEVDRNGILYITDKNNHKIRKINTNGQVSTLAGSPTNGNGFADGIGDAAAFSLPTGLAIDSSGNILVADRASNRIRKITPSGMVTTIAGEGNFGMNDGYNTTAKFTYPYDITLDPLGNIWVTDEFNHLIRKIDTSGYVSTIAGTGVFGSQDGNGLLASVNWPQGIQLSNDGRLLFTDFGNNKIRSINQYGTVETYAGTGSAGLINGNRLSSAFQNPGDIAQDKGGTIFIADNSNNIIRKVLPNGEVTTFAGIGIIGSRDGYADSASFYNPTGVAIDSIGNVYVADQWNHKIRKIERGFRVNPSLPDGIHIDSIGRISGTPKVAIPATIYSVIAENSYGSDTATFTLSVLDCEIPNFSPFPDTLNVCSDTAILNVLGSGLSYLWNTGDTSAQITAYYSGTYSVKVTDQDGCTASDSTILSLVTAKVLYSDSSVCIGDSVILSSKKLPYSVVGQSLPGTLSNGLVASFPFNSNANDESGNGNNGNIFGASLTTDRFGNANSAFNFDGIDDYILTENTSSTGITGDLTISLWMNTRGRELFNTSNYQTLVTKRDVGNITYEMALFFYSASSFSVNSGKILPPTFQYIIESQNIDNVNKWDHYVIVTKSDTGYIYVNGQKLATPNGNIFPFKSQIANAGLTIGSAGGVQYFNGKLDDIFIWNRALSSQEIEGVKNLSQNYSIRWSTGDTTSSITVSPRETTTYTLTVTDGITTCTDQVTITVNQVDTSLTAIDTTAICVGGSARLQAGTGASYVWLKNGSVINGASSSLYSATSAGVYRVVVTNASGCSDTSRVVTITERPLPVSGAISGGGVAVCSGTNSTAMTLTGSVGTIRWQSSLDSLVFTDIANATSSGYTATNLTSTTYYRVITTNSCGSDTSSVVKIQVNPTPVARFSVDSATQVLRANLFVFTNSSTPAQGLSYYWDFGNGFFSNLKDPSYSYRSSGTYQVKLRVTSAAGCVDSSSQLVEVRESPIAVNDTYSTLHATAVSGNVSSNDTPSPDGGNVWSLVGANGGSRGGTITMGATGAFTYTPRSGFSGADTIRYQVCDVNGDCMQAFIYVTVGAAPPPPPPPPPPAVGNLYVAGTSCSTYKAGTALRLSRICYTVSERKVSAVTPSSFMYFVTVTAPSSSFTVNIAQTVSQRGFRLMKVSTEGSTAWGDNCVKIASVSSPASGQARVSISKATVGRTYIIGVMYDVRSLISHSTNGTVIPVFSFSAKIGNQVLPNSSSSITAYPSNCANAPSGLSEQRLPGAGGNPSLMLEPGAMSDRQLSIWVYPNPTRDYFTVEVGSEDKITMGNLRVLNGIGQAVEVYKGVKSGDQLQVGRQLNAGQFIIEYRQGDKQVRQKVLKL